MSPSITEERKGIGRSVNDIIQLPDTSDLVLYKPHAIAEAANLPLHIARSWLASRPLFPVVGQDGKHYVSRNVIEWLAVKYLDDLNDTSPLLDHQGFSFGKPVLPAWIDDLYCLHVWCCWCRCWHHHGRGDGARIPHCEWNSPWKQRGSYILKIQGAWTPEVRKLAPSIQYPRIEE